MELTQKEYNEMLMKNYITLKDQDNQTKSLKSQLRTVITIIAQKGVIPEQLNWADLRTYLLLTMKDECLRMYEKYQDITRTLENNFEDLLFDLIELFLIFEKE